jgi:hypothetical protein
LNRLASQLSRIFSPAWSASAAQGIQSHGAASGPPGTGDEVRAAADFSTDGTTLNGTQDAFLLGFTF